MPDPGVDGPEDAKLGILVSGEWLDRLAEAREKRSGGEGGLRQRMMARVPEVRRMHHNLWLLWKEEWQLYDSEGDTVCRADCLQAVWAFVDALDAVPGSSCRLFGLLAPSVLPEDQREDYARYEEFFYDANDIAT